MTADAARAAQSVPHSLQPEAWPGPDLLAGAQEVAAIAAAEADRIDRQACFPQAAVDAMREYGLLGAMVPPDLGGPGASLDTVAAICRTLGAACSSTGMIFAMHQIQVACLIEHARGSLWHESLLARVAAGQWLLASATSEQAADSEPCALESEGARFRLRKMAPAISHGAHADALLVAARRDAAAGREDQVLVCLMRGDYTLQQAGAWDTLGMRGTCSQGFRLEATCTAEQIVPVAFGEIADATMMPVSHILWAALWTGIAADAVQRARAFLRGQARTQADALPPSAARVAEALSILQTMEGRLQAAIQRLSRCEAAMPVSALFALAAEMNGLKTAMSRLALDAVQLALLACGMAGYKYGTPFSLGRHLRDLWSAPLMINNDRILTNTASLLLAERSN
ncbi:acyl-CoA dehydrogenase family protein [Cupriavidus sp. AU9028]|uniref:acyl-CoA dehydrogenase family protein n=1 Tax=Cupriavidus sp. AU9028 TaxID=2871157 RepID=UPI001C948D3D|nr:acyl-CoA dehydrogenase family protein [Cupriavidus sp. AU9028]MBY4896862.1 acyl-CoA/acyl-ACP dehydrogenase [Cupriavidus sp. AU9028]